MLSSPRGVARYHREVTITRRVSVEDAKRLKRNGVGIRFEKILRLEGDGGLLRRVHFMTGKPLERSALFFHSGVEQRSTLPADLGCLLTRKGHVKPGKLEETNVPGLYVAGDCSRDVQFIIVAAAEGARAAVGINQGLRRENER